MSMLNKLRNKSGAILALVVALTTLVPAAMSQTPPDTTADVVYGQLGSFTTNSSGNEGTPTSLRDPSGIALDSSGNVYVADALHNRVLFYPLGSVTATRVYGQGGSFYTGASNNGGTSANSLAKPQGIVLDGGGNLYVADTNNHRVLFYPAGSTTATRVYGQGGNFTTGIENNGGISANSLFTPLGVALDSSGNLYVADTYNNRVLFYPAGSTTATRVYGQLGSFTTNTAHKGGISANSLSGPAGVATDSSGNLYVADTYNPNSTELDESNRVLFYLTGSTTATRVYGQGGSFTIGTGLNVGIVISANTLLLQRGDDPGSDQPEQRNDGMIGLAVDSGGNFYVADRQNHRVLFYPAGSTTATRVYGQGGNFNTASVLNLSATSLIYPRGVAVDGSGNLFVADTRNNRVLFYPAGFTTATGVYGQGGNFTTTFDNYGGVTANSLSFAPGVATDSGGNLYVADASNHRVLFYPAGSTTATRVYGQGGSFTTNPYDYYNRGSTSATSLVEPRGVTLDSSDNLYVADSGNQRVLFYQAGSTTATRVYGQGGNFTISIENNGGISATSLRGPIGVTLDSGGNLYVADQGNNRVLFYPAGSTTATRVYGQGGNFATNTYNNGGISATSLSNPFGVTLDSRGNLYVADTYNNRVLFYPAGSTTATRVYGQGGNFATNTYNNGGISATSLSVPWGVATDSNGNLYVADTQNQRAMFYPAGSTTATQVYGQGGNFTTNIENNGGISATSLFTALGVTLDSSGNLYVADRSRVLKYNNSTSVAVTVNTNPAGRSFSVDNVTYSSAQTFNFTVGSPHTLATTTPQAGAPGTRYAFASWSDAGAINHAFTVSAAATLTANFTTQYQLTTTAGTGGTISPASGFYNAGNVVVTATPGGGGYLFSRFSGALTGTTNPQTLNLLAPATVSAAFNRPPTSGGQTEGIAPNTAKTFTLNVGDLDGDALTFLTMTAPTKGTVTYNAATKQATYTPNPGATGTDSFTYKATDPGGLSTTATVNLTYLTGVNGALGFVSRTYGIEGGGACVSGVSIYRIVDTMRNASTVSYTGVQGKIIAINNATLVELIVDQTADRILSPAETFTVTGRVKIISCGLGFAVSGTFFGTPYTGTVVFGRRPAPRVAEPTAIGEFSFEGFAGGPTTE